MASRSSSPKSLCLFLLLLAFCPSFTLGWGAEGHFITCSLAESLFSKETAAAVKDLLPKYAEGSLANVCSWADQVRRTRAFYWSGGLHFIDTPDFQCNYNHDRDCHDSRGDPDVCSSGGINNFTSQLRTYGSDQSSYNLTVALLFLSHLMGDIHQPLHVGYTGDEGGNTIIVHWYRRKANLHHVWDSGIIDTAKERFYNSDLQGLVDDLSHNVTENWEEASKWGTCHAGEFACPDAYAREGIKAACKWAYKDASQGAVLEDDYFLSRLPIVKQRLSQGGVRLAATLNRIFGQKQVGSE